MYTFAPLTGAPNVVYIHGGATGLVFGYRSTVIQKSTNVGNVLFLIASSTRLARNTIR